MKRRERHLYQYWSLFPWICVQYVIWVEVRKWCLALPLHKVCVHLLIKSRDRLLTHKDHYNPVFRLMIPFWKHKAKSSKLLDYWVFLGWTLHFYIGLLLCYAYTQWWLSFSIQSFIVRCCLFFCFVDNIYRSSFIL